MIKLGVALSILGNNTASLVGVAISAALLPPVVNSGLNLGYSFVRLYHYTNASTPEAIEFAIIAGYSWAIAVVNIVLIYLFAVLLLKVCRLVHCYLTFY